MSFFSSLILFYPGDPPSVKLHEARRLCDQLRKDLSLTDTYAGVSIKYGKAINQDFHSTNEIEWDEKGTSGRLVSYPWDHEKRDLPWPELWPGNAFDSRNLYRAYCGLGGLPRTVSSELMAMRNEQTSHDYIAPDSLSFQIDPVCPATLATEELVCYGLMEISFAGNGFFTWQLLSRYWEQVRASSALGTVMRICRETFPVPPLDSLDEVKTPMGEMFLNREEYQQGDWIVSVSETG